MYKLKSIVRRSSLLGASLALVAATFLPATLTYADALNPLTSRTLTLSSSSPGWDFTDGSGNPTYAQPNSGANGQKTGNTFSFNVSTDSHAVNPVKAFTFQYCTLAAGICMSPGNDGFTGSSPTAVRNADDIAGHKTDLKVVAATPTEISSGTATSIITAGDATGIPARDNSQGNFVVLYKDVSGSWTYSGGWSMAVSHNEDGGDALHANGTDQNNFITITNATGVGLHSGGSFKVIFFGTDTNYVTNPGFGAFFVKINDYNDDTTLDNTTLMDGGVTVANVVNQSIEIQTKVLETMDFSVGTVDPDTLDSTGGVTSQLHAANGASSHGQCDSILPGITPAAVTAGGANTLQLGDTSAENSLSTTHTYSTHSYWRLSSNSSAGATVYYSGETLSNTEGDQIAAIGTTAQQPHLGTPQFGLALDNGTGSTYAVDYNVEEDPGFAFENAADVTAHTQGIDASTTTDTAALLDYHDPSLTPMAPTAQYGGGTGNVNNLNYGDGTGGHGSAGVNTTFAFDANSNIAPVPIASDAGQVVDCVTAKVRYIANIAATTPAGIYTTKINYIAAPEY